MVRLRPLSTSDAESIWAAVAMSRAELEQWMDWCHPAYGPADAADFVDRSTTARAVGTSAHFIITDEHHDLLGVVGVEDIAADSDVATIGYWMATPHAGQGIAPKAIGRAIEWAFTHTHVVELLAFIAPGNTRSRRAAEKAGMAPRAAPHPRRQPPPGQMTYSIEKP